MAQNKMANNKKTGSTAHVENSDFQGWISCTKCAERIYSQNISLGSWAAADNDGDQQLLQMKGLV